MRRGAYAKDEFRRRSETSVPRQPCASDLAHGVFGLVDVRCGSLTATVSVLTPPQSTTFLPPAVAGGELLSGSHDLASTWIAWRAGESRSVMSEPARRCGRPVTQPSVRTPRPSSAMRVCMNPSRAKCDHNRE